MIMDAGWWVMRLMIITTVVMMMRRVMGKKDKDVDQNENEEGDHKLQVGKKPEWLMDDGL